MADSSDDRAFRRRMERVEVLLGEVERFADPAARAHTRELVQAVLELHGAGLGRMLEVIAGSQDAGPALIDSLAGVGLVGSLLLLHGLHPLGVETRVRQALDSLRPYLRSHAASAELLGVVGGVVRLRMVGRAEDALTLKQAVEEAVYEKVPDVAGVVVERATNGSPAGGGRPRVALPLVGGWRGPTE